MSPMSTYITHPSHSAPRTSRRQATQQNVEPTKMWKIISHDCSASNSMQSSDSSSASGMDISEPRPATIDMDFYLDEIIFNTSTMRIGRRQHVVSHNNNNEKLETDPCSAAFSDKMEVDVDDDKTVVDAAASAKEPRVDDFLDEIIGSKHAQVSCPSSSTSSYSRKTNSLNTASEQEKRKPYTPATGPSSQEANSSHTLSHHSTITTTTSEVSLMPPDMEIDAESMSKELRLEMAKRRATASVRRPTAAAAADAVRGRPQHKDVCQLWDERRSWSVPTGPRNSGAIMRKNNTRDGRRHHPHSRLRSC